MIYMTLPFENDTKTIIKRISSRNISANRKKISLLLLRLHLRVHYYLQLPFMDLELHRKQKI